MKLKLLILNLGSSSIKYQLLENNKFLIKGLIERIGMSGSRIKQICFKQKILIYLENVLSSIDYKF